jgi:Ca-activated chloride channel family protein
MEASVRLDHELVAVASDDDVHAMLELTFPEAPADAERPPLNIALVLDRSGSMTGEKLHVTKACAKHLVRRLRADDQIAVVSFDDQVRLETSLAPVDADEVCAAIDDIEPNGATNLSGGWLKGVEELRRAEVGARRALVLLTDGQANHGVTEAKRLVAMTSGAKSMEGTSTTTIGFGDGFDEDLLAAMADAGGGNAHYAPTPEAAPAIFAQEFEGLSTTVAQNVSVELRPSPAVEMLGVLNDYPTVPVVGGVQVELGDGWGGERRRLVFSFHVPAVAGLGPASIAEVVVRWTDVTGAPALHELTIPVVVNVAPGEEAAEGPVDPGVKEEVVILEAARAQSDARLAADAGKFGIAQARLDGRAGALRALAETSDRADELLAVADAIDEMVDVVESQAWDGGASKTALYASRSTSRPRRRS